MIRGLCRSAVLAGTLAFVAAVAAVGVWWLVTMEPQGPHSKAAGWPGPPKERGAKRGRSTAGHVRRGSGAPGGAAATAPESADPVRDRAVHAHRVRLAQLELQFNEADRHHNLPRATADAFRRDIAALRAAYGGEITDADWQCHGLHCRLRLFLRSGRAIKPIITRAMWLGGGTDGKCTYEALSEPGPPPQNRAQTLRAYYACKD